MRLGTFLSVFSSSFLFPPNLAFSFVFSYATPSLRLLSTVYRAELMIGERKGSSPKYNLGKRETGRT
jgi:hypothetical protein